MDMTLPLFTQTMNSQKTTPYLILKASYGMPVFPDSNDPRTNAYETSIRH